MLNCKRMNLPKKKGRLQIAGHMSAIKTHTLGFPRIGEHRELKKATEAYWKGKLSLEQLHARNLWVNPDCGLKTRGWEEVKPSLVHMFSAARNLRASY